MCSRTTREGLHAHLLVALVVHTSSAFFCLHPTLWLLCSRKGRAERYCTNQLGRLNNKSRVSNAYYETVYHSRASLGWFIKRRWLLVALFTIYSYWNTPHYPCYPKHFHFARAEKSWRVEQLLFYISAVGPRTTVHELRRSSPVLSILSIFCLLLLFLLYPVATSSSGQQQTVRFSSVTSCLSSPLLLFDNQPSLPWLLLIVTQQGRNYGASVSRRRCGSQWHSEGARCVNRRAKSTLAIIRCSSKSLDTQNGHHS